jgi:hypothetical protein
VKGIGQSIVAPTNAPGWVGTLTQAIQRYVDQKFSGPVQMGRYAASDLPDASRFYGCNIFVHDDASGGASMQFSNGTSWQVVTSGGGGAYLPLSGGTLTGPLILNADPTQPLGAATKQEVDGVNAALTTETTNRTNADTTLTNNKVAKSGDTMTGSLSVTPNLAVGTAVPSGMLAGSMIASQDATVGATYYHNAYYSGGFKAVVAGYSGYMSLDKAGGSWTLALGSNVAAGATPTMTTALSIAANGASTFNGAMTVNNNVTIAGGNLTFTGGGNVIGTATSYLLLQPAGGAGMYFRSSGGAFINIQDTTTDAVNIASGGGPTNFGGNVKVNSGRLASVHSADWASVTCYQTAVGTAAGMFVGEAGQMRFGPTDANGYPSSTWASLNATQFYVPSGSGVYANGDASFGINFLSPNYRMQFDANAYIFHQRSTGQYGWQSTAGTSMIFDTSMGCTFGQNIACQQGYKPGGGSWAASSDIRIKDVTGNYTAGLDELLQVTPRTFKYLGNDTPTSDLYKDPTKPETSPGDPKDAGVILAAPYSTSPHYQVATEGKEFIGFIAQELEDVFPEMVTQKAAFIDGESVLDVRDIDTGPLIYALVNATKTLSAKLDDALARIEALEMAR